MIGNELDIPVQSLTPEGKFQFFKLCGYKPHRGQRKFHRRKERYRVIAAASRLGKSTGAAYEAIAYAHLHHKMIWCVGPTYELSEKVFRIVRRVLVEERKYPTVIDSYRDRKLVLPWGTEIYGKSANNPDSLLGEGVDFMVIDEAARISKEVWEEYLLMRLLDKAGMALIISSTKGTEGWFPELYRRGHDMNFPDWWSVRCPLTDNTAIPRLAQQIEQLRKEMSSEAFAQEVLGKFVPFGGLVYKEWREKKHVTKEAEFNPESPIILAVDFGTRNPCAALFTHRVGEKLFDQFDEYYVAGRDTIEHARAIRAKLRPYLKKCKSKTVMCYHDPAGLDESLIFKKLIPELVMIPAVNDIEPGINTVRTHLKYDDDKGRPHYRVNPRCEFTVWEFGVYHYPKTRQRVVRKITENPVDVDNHAVAAVRYLLHTLVPAAGLPLLIEDLCSDFADPYLGIQEAPDGYYSEIDTLKSLAYPEDETDPYSS